MACPLWSLVVNSPCSVDLRRSLRASGGFGRGRWWHLNGRHRGPGGREPRGEHQRSIGLDGMLVRSDSSLAWRHKGSQGMVAHAGIMWLSSLLLVLRPGALIVDYSSKARSPVRSFFFLAETLGVRLLGGGVGPGSCPSLSMQRSISLSSGKRKTRANRSDPKIPSFHDEI